MRTLTWMLFLVSLVAAIHAADAPVPLSEQGDLRAEIDHALQALSRGDTGPLEALPLTAFTTPVALPDVHDHSITRRWTAYVPTAIAHLDAAARAHAVASLDGRYQALLGTAADGDSAARAAVDFVPAPSATKALVRAANQAFDHGHFFEFLALAQILAIRVDTNSMATPATAENPETSLAQRVQIARNLSGRGTQVDAALRLAAPGTPQPTAAHPQQVPPGLTVRWATVPGWLMACDPWARVVWQHHIELGAVVCLGDGGALVRDTGGLRLLNESGQVTPLPAAPPGAQILAVAGGAAWFATGTRAWRLLIDTQSLQSLEVGAQPLSPPLVRGAQSLWLTREALVLFDGDRETAHFTHHLPATPGWRLGSDGDRPLLLSETNTVWRLESLAEELARLGPIARAPVLIAAGRAQEAIEMLMAMPPVHDVAVDATRAHALMRAHLALGGTHLLEEWLDEAHVMAQARTAQDQAQFRMARLLAAVSATTPHAFANLLPMIDRFHRPTLYLLGPVEDDANVLDVLADTNKDVLLTLDPSMVAADPSTWNQVLSGRGWLRWRRDAQGLSDAGSISAEQPVESSVVSLVPSPEPLGTSAGDRVHLNRDVGFITVTCRASDGGLLWKNRWMATSFLDAPTQAVDCHADQVFVLEGGSRLTVLDAALGCTLGQFFLHGTTPALENTILVNGMNASNGMKVFQLLFTPVGVPDRLHAIDWHSGDEHEHALPSALRWLLSIPGQAWAMIACVDGSAQRYPGSAVLTLPNDLIMAASAPYADDRGLWSNRLLFPWRRSR